MKYITVNNYVEEIHPWPPYIPSKANKIIIGTFPTSERNRSSYNFYYPNPKNEFWNILFKIADKDIVQAEKINPVLIRQQVLEQLNLGIGDIGKRILRQKDSSKDQNLFPLEFTDIFSLLDSTPSLTKLILTSSSGPNSVLAWVKHYFQLNNVYFPISGDSLPMNESFMFKNRKISVDILASTSTLSPIRGDRRYNMYRESILEL